MTRTYTKKTHKGRFEKINSLHDLKTQLSKGKSIADEIFPYEVIERYKEYFTSDQCVDEHLIELSNDNNPFYRVMALQLLAAFFLPKYQNIFIEKAKDENVFVRGEAVSLMSVVNIPSFLESLIAATKDEEPYVRFRAVHALRIFNGSMKIQALDAIKALRMDPDEDVKELAILSIVEKDKFHGIDVLISRIEKEDRKIRQRRRDMIAKILSRMTYGFVLERLRQKKYGSVGNLLKALT